MPEAQLNLAHAVMYLANAPEVELGRRPRWAPRMPTCATGRRVRSPPTSGTPITLAPRSSGTATGTCTRTTSPTDGCDQQYRPDDHDERYWQPTGRGADVDRRGREAE